MKLRILGNSLRLRVTRTETERLGRGEPVEASVAFPGGGKLMYRLEAKRDFAKIHAAFDGRVVAVGLPLAEAGAWANSTAIALQAEIEAGAGETLKILVEKDFACLKPRQNQVEDESDLFPNPNEAHGSCGHP